MCPGRLCAVCDCGPGAGLVQREHRQPSGGVVLGASRRPAGHGAPPGVLEAVAKGDLPTPEPLAAEQMALPLALGADGVMVPFRPAGGAPTGKTRWREI